MKKLLKRLGVLPLIILCYASTAFANPIFLPRGMKQEEYEEKIAMAKIVNKASQYILIALLAFLLFIVIKAIINKMRKKEEKIKKFDKICCFIVGILIAIHIVFRVVNSVRLYSSLSEVKGQVDESTYSQIVSTVKAYTYDKDEKNSTEVYKVVKSKDISYLFVNGKPIYPFYIAPTFREMDSFYFLKVVAHYYLHSYMW